MIFAGPGVPKEKQWQGHAYLRDVFPTLLELTGLPPIQCDGKSQVPVMHGQTPSIYDFTVGYFRNSQRMIRTDQWKFIEYPLINQTQLFDLHHDSLEQHDLSHLPEHASLKKKLAGKLSQWIEAQRALQPKTQ